MKKRCKNCRHWCGIKYSTWGDCYCVIGELCPQLFAAYIEYYDQDTGETFLKQYWSIPFDPHDDKYWSVLSENFSNIYYKMWDDKIISLPPGIKRNVIKIKDIVFDIFGNEKETERNILVFQTNKNYSCKFFEEI